MSPISTRVFQNPQNLSAQTSMNPRSYSPSLTEWGLNQLEALSLSRSVAEDRRQTRCELAPKTPMRKLASVATLYIRPAKQVLRRLSNYSAHPELTRLLACFLLAYITDHSSYPRQQTRVTALDSEPSWRNSCTPRPTTSWVETRDSLEQGNLQGLFTLAWISLFF